MMSGPFIVADYGRWIVGSNVTVDRLGAGVEIASEEKYLTTPPRSGWLYRDGYWYESDDTLRFLPGGLDVVCITEG